MSLLGKKVKEKHYPKIIKKFKKLNLSHCCLNIIWLKLIIYVDNNTINNVYFE